MGYIYKQTLIQKGVATEILVIRKESFLFQVLVLGISFD